HVRMDNSQSSLMVSRPVLNPSQTAYLLHSPICSPVLAAFALRSSGAVADAYSQANGTGTRRKPIHAGSEKRRKGILRQSHLKISPTMMYLLRDFPVSRSQSRAYRKSKAWAALMDSNAKP